MRKSVFVFLVLFIALSSGIIFVQDNNFVQFNGGIIYPRRSHLTDFPLRFSTTTHLIPKSPYTFLQAILPGTDFM